MPVDLKNINQNFGHYIQFANNTVIVISLLTFIVYYGQSIIPASKMGEALRTAGWTIFSLFWVYVTSIIGNNVSKNMKPLLYKSATFMFLMTFMILLSFICGLTLK
jgi:hypothetical protein